MTDCTCKPVVLHTDDCAINKDATVTIKLPDGRSITLPREPLVDVQTTKPHIYTVICTDTFDGTTWPLGWLTESGPKSFATLDEAREAARVEAEGKSMFQACVHEDGRHRQCFGSR